MGEFLDQFGRDWTQDARCVGTNPDALFVQGAKQNKAKNVCRNCIVKGECLAEALDNRIEFGVWGGKTERERRAILRRFPHINDWRRVIIASLAVREANKGAE